MKKLIAFSFLLVLALIAVAAPASAAETVLRITLQLPLKSHLGQNLLLFQEQVEERSQGAIDVQIYDSAQLYKDKEVPQAVGSGQIEMGVASLTRFVGDIPAVDIFYLPFLFNSEPLVRAATAPDSPIRQAIDDAIAETGSKVLWWQAYGGAIMLSKDEPIRTPEDIKGKKVRVFGKTLGNWVRATGGAPTITAGSEQYLAYQRGTVDVGMTGISGVQARRLWEVMDWVTVTNNADIEFIVLINKDVWDGLSDEHKRIVEDAAANAERVVRDEMARLEAEAYREAEANGMQIYRLSPEEVASWKESAQPVVDQYLQASGELGQTLYDAALALPARQQD